MKIQETFNHDTEPMVQPQIAPKPQVVPAPDKVQPNVTPSRRNKPFLPMPEVQPDPKAMTETMLNEGVWADMMKGVRKGQPPFDIIAIERGWDANGPTSKVAGQKNNITIPDIVPAEYEAMKRKYPNAIIEIEDATGRILWNNKKYMK